MTILSIESKLEGGSLVLNTYLIDVVRPVRESEDTPAEEAKGPQVQLVTYKVLASNPNEALQKCSDDAGVIVQEGDIVDRIMVGIEQAQMAIDV